MYMSAKNKLGVNVEYAFDLSRDLMRVHGIAASDIVENMYGTQFTILQKQITPGDPKDKKGEVTEFSIVTNDSRDAPRVWRQTV